MHMGYYCLEGIDTILDGKLNKKLEKYGEKLEKVLDVGTYLY